MKYKQWSDEELIRQGKRLAELIPKAWAQIKKAPQTTYKEVYYLLKDIEAVNLGQHTLQLLRDEYKRRKSNPNPQTRG